MRWGGRKFWYPHNLGYRSQSLALHSKLQHFYLDEAHLWQLHLFVKTAERSKPNDNRQVAAAELASATSIILE